MIFEVKQIHLFKMNIDKSTWIGLAASSATVALCTLAWMKLGRKTKLIMRDAVCQTTKPMVGAAKRYTK